MTAEITARDNHPGQTGPIAGLKEWWQTQGIIWLFVLKALLSACLALWFSYRLELPQPATVLATVFIVLQRNSGDVLAKSFYRILGTLAGLLVMVTLIALFNQQRELFLLLLASWLGVCVAGATRYRDFRSYACILAGYTAVMIGIPAVQQPDTAFLQALWRVIEIVVGILCTAVVSGTLFPQTSSASLRRAQALCLRDFALFASEGLQGQLEADVIRARQADFAARMVTMDSLLTASAFEDPRIRVRQGRLARMNFEFMRMTTRFHALQQLLLRHGMHSDAANKLQPEALAPCLQLVANALTPLRGELLSDQKAEEAAESIARRQQELMETIRLARETQAQLSRGLSHDLQMDFKTAAELLYRFMSDLHSRLITQASLLDHAHQRETLRRRFTARTNGTAALVAGFRCVLMVLLLGGFWLMTAWPSGDVAVLTVGLVAGLVSVATNPARLAVQILAGAVASGAAGFLLQFYVYPWIDGFPMLFAVLTPVFAMGAFLLARPVTMGFGVGWCIWFCILSLPGNQVHYLPYQFLNNWLAALLAMLVAAVTVGLLLPPGQPWLWRRLEKDLRRQVSLAVTARLEGLESRFDSSTRDILSQAYTLSATRPDVQEYLLRWMASCIETGHAIIELRQEWARMMDGDQRQLAAVAAPLRRALARLFLEPGKANLARALAGLEAVIGYLEEDHAEKQSFARSPRRRMLSYLHFMRTALLDPRSPLLESPPAGMERAGHA